MTEFFEVVFVSFCIYSMQYMKMTESSREYFESMCVHNILNIKRKIS